jgi:hypothetical protein
MGHTPHARETLVELLGTVVARHRDGVFKVQIDKVDRVVEADRADRRQRRFSDRAGGGAPGVIASASSAVTGRVKYSMDS